MKNSASYLAVTQPKQGDYLVVEGWQTEDSLAQALNKFKGSTYQYLIATGGPDTRYINPEYKTYAERSAAFLLAQGLDARKLIVISAPASAQNRTFLSAVMVRDYLAKKNIAPISLDIFTQGVHAKRTHELYQMAFRDDDNIGIYSSVPANYDLKAWWKTSEGAKSVITEIVGLLWVKCCFNPGKPGSHQEKWGLVKNQSS
ncbi:MAG: hypothetical protein COA63_012730 [Methylophaga sp.]|nr:hypothetical protein [Methylophaga sp.]